MNIRHINALMIFHIAAVFNQAVNLAACYFFDFQLNQAIVNQDWAADRYIGMEGRIGHADAGAVAFKVFRRKDDHITGF